MAFTNNDIRFSVVFNDFPKLTFTDLIQSAYLNTYSIVLAVISIRLKVECTNGGVIYDNLLGVTPDITLGSSWTKEILISDGLNINADGKIVEGVYTITYQVYDAAADETYTKVVTHDFGYERPVANLVLDYSCGTSLVAPFIRSKDNTVYNAVWNGISHTGAVTYLSHKLNRPISSGASQIVQVVPLQELTSTELWTLTNTSQISSEVVFTIDTQTNVIVYYKTYINVETEINVACEECTCLFWSCFNAIYDKYYQFAGVNQMQSSKYYRLLTEISINYNMFHKALNCGEDTTKFCNKLKELAVSENCTCTASQTQSYLISPVLGGGSALAYVNGASVDGSGHLILTYSDGSTSDAGLVTGSQGTPALSIISATIDGSGSLLIEFSNNDIVNAGIVVGSAGADGANGTAILKTDLFNETLATQTPNVYNAFSNSYLFASNFCPSLGDQLKIKAVFDQQNNDQAVGIRVNGTVVAASNFQTNGKVIVEAEITRQAVYSAGVSSTFLVNNTIKTNIEAYTNMSYLSKVLTDTNTLIEFVCYPATNTPCKLIQVTVEKSEGGLI